jgi:G3E family GTPase
MTQSAPIPVTVIGGFLGAGKTTLVNRILRSELPTRFAVLVNDFGEINIDADLIERHDGDTINLANGCVCCSIGDSLISTLLQLTSRSDPPDHIVIEASGVANPMRIAEIAIADPASFHLDAVVVIVDAKQVRDQAADRYVGELVGEQIESADLLVLNKIDLVDGTARDEIRTWLDRRRGSVPVIETVGSDVVSDLLFRTLPRSDVACGNRFRAFEVRKDHDGMFDSVSFQSDRQMERGALERFGAALPATILRGKGIVSLAGEGPVAVHRAGRRWNIERVRVQTSGVSSTRLVLIGHKDDFDVAHLERLFAEMVGESDDLQRAGATRDATAVIQQEGKSSCKSAA